MLPGGCRAWSSDAEDASRGLASASCVVRSVLLSTLSPAPSRNSFLPICRVNDFETADILYPSECGAARDPSGNHGGKGVPLGRAGGRCFTP